MCDNHAHPHDRVARADGGQHQTVKAVDSPVDKVYDNPRTFILEVAQRFFDNRETWEDLRDPDKRVIKGKEIPFKSKTENDRLEGSKAWGKSYVRPWKGVTQSMSIMERVLAPEADDKKHAHQNEAMMYVLEGKGYEIHDGTEYEWEAGDLVVIHSGCVHEHYSADPDSPCRLLVFNSLPIYNYLHLIYQGTVRHTPGDAAKDPAWVPPWEYSVGREEYSKEDQEMFAQMREALRKEDAAKQSATESA
jgi:quercetin dioxygenase-like cupin family protein